MVGKKGADGWHRSSLASLVSSSTSSPEDNQPRAGRRSRCSRCSRRRRRRARCCWTPAWRAWLVVRFVVRSLCPFRRSLSHRVCALYKRHTSPQGALVPQHRPHGLERGRPSAPSGRRSRSRARARRSRPGLAHRQRTHSHLRTSRPTLIHCPRRSPARPQGISTMPLLRSSFSIALTLSTTTLRCLTSSEFFRRSTGPTPTCGSRT